jgi:hypothetical protein
LITRQGAEPDAPDEGATTFSGAADNSGEIRRRLISHVAEMSSDWSREPDGKPGAPSRGTRMSCSPPALPRQFAAAKEFDESTAG